MFQDRMGDEIMRGLVVYHSRWGNCEKIARQIAKGLEEAEIEVDVVGSEQRNLSLDYDFIIVGSPTRIGNASRGIRSFIAREISGKLSEKPFAAFGTGILKFREKGEPQSAQRIHSLLEGLGLKPITAPLSAAVLKVKGPLAQGELENAHKYGLEVASKLK